MSNLIYIPQSSYLKIITLSVTLMMLFSSFKMAAQNCAKTDKIDKFTNARTIESDQVKVYGSNVAVSLIFGSGSGNWGYYTFFTLKNNELFFSLNDKGEYHNTTVFDNIILKLSNEKIINLNNFKSDGAYNKGSNSYEKSHSKIDKNTIDMLINFNITDMRFSIDNTPIDAKIDKSTAERIKKQALCISTYLPESFSSQSINDNLKNQIETTNNDIPQPSNDTLSVSLYKQWKLIANLDKDGIPRDLKSTSIKQIFKDGTYKTAIIPNSGKIIEVTGTYQLLNDNSIIVFTQKTGESSTSKIIKLTNKELETKSADSHLFYTVY